MTVFSVLGYVEQVYGNNLLLYDPKTDKYACIRVEKDVVEEIVFTVLSGMTFDSSEAIVSTRNPKLAMIYAIREMERRSL